MCDTCNKKQDALKGLKLHKLPYFLTVLLKRFEFDLQTMRRIKLGNKISFPLVLDMNPFVNEGESVNVSIEEAFGIPMGEQPVGLPKIFLINWETPNFGHTFWV
jgi:ubiquitin C-terminal hydrolase